ncbi:uncharacterized protein LOC133657643 [Entelurus aequoreus]|uniref:uncharacterized protein LOC133657643 n=1 Tax=Entelurus aequoreus TaxID=161455 RepID=UPI002B1E5DE5|nr:uncharacterized protein LOC133657643 [Entelurus aequoreus]
MSNRAKKEEQRKEDLAASTIMATLTTMLADHKTSLSSEFNSAFSKLNNTLDCIQTTLLENQKRLSSLELFADTTSQDMLAMNTKLTFVTEENARLKAKLIDLESRSRRNNIRIVGVPENIEGPNPTTFFSQLLVEVLGEHTLSSTPELDRAHRSLTAKPGPGERPRAIVICFHRFQTRELVVREARKRRGKLRYKDSPIHIFEDYCPEILEQRAVYRDVMRDLYNLGLKPALHYPAKLMVSTEGGKRRRLASLKDAQDFVKSHNQRSQEHSKE